MPGSSAGYPKSGGAAVNSGVAGGSGVCPFGSLSNAGGAPAPEADPAGGRGLAQ